MNWTKWSSIAEITSSIAIVLTLAYLAIQTQQNTEAINSQSRQSLFEYGVQEQSLWMQYPEITELLLDNSLDISLSQKTQLDGLLIVALSRRQFAWNQYQAGILDEHGFKKLK